VSELSARNRTRKRRLIVTALATVVVLLVVADWYQRNREMDHLLDQVERSEAAMKTFLADRDEAFTQFGNEGCSQATASTPTCQTALQALRDGLSQTSAEDVVAIQTAGSDVGHVSVLPWHRSLIAARDAYVGHNEAWVKLLDDGASDVSALFDKGSLANISATFITAHSRFNDAVPPIALHRAKARIHDIWEAEQDSQG
jgi:hypothetical protein